MATFLLTWNGDPSSFVDPNFEELVESTQRGGAMPGYWSFGNRRSGTSEGDVVYLLMQGKVRGIVARGVLISSALETRPHWRDPSRDAVYAPVLWHSVLPLEFRLTTDVLEQMLPEFNWRVVLASGQRMPDAVAQSLDQLWEERVEEALGDHTTSAGSLNDVYAWLARNKANVSHVLDHALVSIRSVFGSDVAMRFVPTFVSPQAAPRVARIEIMLPPDIDSGWARLIQVHELLIAREEQLQRQTNSDEPLLSVQLVLAGSDANDWPRRPDESDGVVND